MGGDHYKARNDRRRYSLKRTFNGNIHTDKKKGSSLVTGSEKKSDPVVKNQKSASSSKLQPVALSGNEFCDTDFNFLMNFDCFKSVLESIHKCPNCSGNIVSDCDVSKRLGLNLTIDISCVNVSRPWIQSFQNEKSAPSE